MKRLLIFILLTVLLLFSLAACGQPETALPTRAALAETAVPPEAEPTTPPSANAPLEIETAVPSPIPNNESEERLPLPALNNESSQPELAGQPPQNDPLETAVFTLNASLPTAPTEAQVWRWTAGPVDETEAQRLAQRWGFNGPLYTFAKPDESFLGEAPAANAAPLPSRSTEYHVFDGPRSLVITDGAAYFADESLTFDYQSPPPFAQRASETETALQTLGLLDFPYTLQDGWGREVWVMRLLDEMAINLPEISAGVVNGRLAFATHQPYENLTALGRYPLISAETAWQQVQAGGGSLRYTLTEDAASANSAPPAGFQYWPRQHQSGQEVHFYTPPTVFNPVSGEGAPLIKALNYTVQTDDETRRTLAEKLGITLHLWGTLDTAANSLVLAGWEPVPDLNPLLKNGTVQRQDGLMILTEPGGNAFILPDAPADLEDGSQVNVFAWAVRDTGLAYPVLDWEGIDRQTAGVSGESLAQPDTTLPESTPITQITINQVELSYYVHPDTAERGAEPFAPLSYWLLPVWQFSGFADSGAAATFYVQATVSNQ